MKAMTSERDALKENDRRHALVCPQHVKNIDPWVRESALLESQAEVKRLREAVKVWQERIAKMGPAITEPWAWKEQQALKWEMAEFLSPVPPAPSQNREAKP